MKKSLSVLLTFCLLFTAAFFVKASVSENRIYSDDSVAEKGATVEIPVKIANNTGFMGFSVSITYNPDEFEPVSVSGSSMLSGMLDNSIESSSTNSFIVLYTGTSDITSDGELFTVCFKVKAAIAGDKSIVLSYNQEDTFDENWNDVKFNCENLRIIVTVGGVNEEPSSSIVNSSEPTSEEPSSSNINPSEPSSEEPSSSNNNPSEPSSEEPSSSNNNPSEPTSEEPSSSNNNPSEPISEEPSSSNINPSEPTSEEPSSSNINPSEPTSEEPSSSNINPTEPTTNSEGDNQDENMKLSERIRRWASGLIFPFNYIMSFILFPVIWIITIFE